jgi:hypothetical protein
VLLVATAWPRSVRARVIAVRMPLSSSINRMLATTARYAEPCLLEVKVGQWRHDGEKPGGAARVTSLRSVVGIATIWLGAVVGASATAWVAIDQAGRDFSRAGVASFDSGSVIAPPPTGRTQGPSPAATGEAPATAGSTTPRDKSITVTGGQVGLRCTGAKIDLRTAQPDNDWRVQVVRSSAGRIAVTFHSDDDEGSGRTQVTAVCAKGAPVVQVGKSVGRHEG